MNAAARTVVTAVLVACSIAASGYELATDDTHVRLEPGDNRISVTVGDDPAVAVLPLIQSAVVDQRTVNLSWRPGVVIQEPADVIANFGSAQPALRLRSTWWAQKGRGPVEHRIDIKNEGDATVVLPLQPSLRFAVSAPAGRTIEVYSVEKGAGTPTAEGVHRQRLSAGDRCIVTSHSTARDNPRDRMPWISIQDVDGHRGWYAGVEFTGDVQIELQRRGDLIDVTLGLAPDEQGTYRTRLTPGETLELPTGFVGCYQGEVDNGCNRLRHWVQAHLAPPPADERYPLLVNNTWGSGMEIDEKLCRKMIDESAELGLEMFHIDAGWYRAVGDWRPDTKKFPNGLTPIADYAHEKGLKFGLWVAWSHGGDRPAAGDHSVLTVRDPAQKDWFTADYDENWRAAPFTGAPVCLADPQAGQWCLKELKRIVREYKLDLLEHDQVMVLDACTRTTHPHTDSPTDISYRAACGYYAVYDALRKEFPQLMLEDCVNGGNMIDYGVVRRVNYISITDTYDPLSNRRAFYDASYALPPAMCECYVQQMPVRSIGEFKQMLRSGMMGWCTIMLDTSQWSPEQHAAAKRQFEIYKTILRPLILHGDLYHVSDRPDGLRWDGIEYFDAHSGKAVLYAFRGSGDEPRHAFVLKGLDAAATYRVKFEDAGGEALNRRGDELMSKGIEVQLNEPQSSELVLLEQVR